MNASSIRPRLVHSVTVGPRTAHIHVQPGTGKWCVSQHWQGKKLAEGIDYDTRAQAMYAAKAYVWHGNGAMRARLQAFMAQHGRLWKSQLLALWESGRGLNEPQGYLLRQARTIIGPEGLKKITTEDLED